MPIGRELEVLAPAHKAHLTISILADKGVILAEAYYSPDLTSGFRLFPEVKEPLRARYFSYLDLPISAVNIGRF